MLINFLKRIVKLNNRMICYGLMLGIYVLYNLNYFVGDVFNLDSEENFSVIKEVFVTFIAIGCFNTDNKTSKSY